MGLQSETKMTEKAKLKAIKYAEKKFRKHMLSFDKKQNEEVEELERMYDKEKAQLEKENQMELAFVLHSHRPSIIDKVKRLEETFEVNSKEHSLKMEICRQNLKKRHAAEKIIEEGVKARLLEEVNSWLRKKVVCTYSHPSEEQSIEDDVPYIEDDVPNMPSPSSLHSGKINVVLALDEIESMNIDETNTLSLENVSYTHPNGMESSIYSGKRIVVLALNKIESKKIDETNTLSLENVAYTPPNGMESSLYSGKRVVILALNQIGSKKIDETNALSLEKVVSGKRIVVLALDKIESKKTDETNILSLENGAYTQPNGMESPGSPEKGIPDRDVVLEDAEISPDMPETAYGEVVEGSQFNREQDGPSLVNYTSLPPVECLSEALQLQDECFQLLPSPGISYDDAPANRIDVVSSDNHEAQTVGQYDHQTTPTGSPLLLQTSTCINSTPGDQNVLTLIEIPFSCHATTSVPSNQKVPLENVVQNQPNPPSAFASTLGHTAIEGRTSIQPTGASLLRARTVVSDFSNRSIQTTSAASVMASRMTHHTYSDSLQNESERIRRETEQMIKISEEAKLQLQSDREKEIEEAIAQIGKKYETLAQDNEQQFQIKKQQLDSNYKNVYMNKMLVEALRYKCMDPRVPGKQGLIHTVGPPVARPRSPAPRHPLSSPSSIGLPSRPSYVSVPRSIGTLASPTAPAHSAAPAPHVQIVHNSASLFSSSSSGPPLHIGTITPPSRNFQVGSGIRAPAPHLQRFRPSVSMPSNNPLPTISPLGPNSNSQLSARPNLHSPSSANGPHQTPTWPGSGTTLQNHLNTMIGDNNENRSSGPIIPNLPSLSELGSDFDPLDFFEFDYSFSG